MSPDMSAGDLLVYLLTGVIAVAVVVAAIFVIPTRNYNKRKGRK